MRSLWVWMICQPSLSKACQGKNIKHVLEFTVSGCAWSTDLLKASVYDQSFTHLGAKIVL